MPYWDCDSCGKRLYSASESLRWQGCPVCEGELHPIVDESARPAPQRRRCEARRPRLRIKR